MKNQNTIFAVMMLILMSMLYFFTKHTRPSRDVVRVNFRTVPLSKGCVYPIKEVKLIKTEIQHIVPIAQVYKCTYDKAHRLVKVSTYDFEIGYQMKIPTEEVLYKWDRFLLTQYSIRRSTHGNGEIDVEIYKLKSR